MHSFRALFSCLARMARATPKQDVGGVEWIATISQLNDVVSEEASASSSETLLAAKVLASRPFFADEALCVLALDQGTPFERDRNRSATLAAARSLVG